MNAYLYVQQLGTDLSSAIAIQSNAPEWAAEFCFLDQQYLNYVDAEPPVSDCSSCLNIPELEKALADFQLVARVGGLQQAQDKVVYALKHGLETISIPVVLDGQDGFGCLYIDVLQEAITRINQALG